MKIPDFVIQYLHRNEPEFKIFIALRLAFFIVCSAAITYIHWYYNDLYNAKLLVIEVALLFLLFFYFLLGLYSARVSERLIRISVELSLFFDLLLIYLTVTVLGNNYFALFHGSYLLVLFHSFYSPSYVRTWFEDNKNYNFLAGGALSSVALSMFLYFLIFSRETIHFFNIKTAGYLFAVSFASILMVYFKRNFLKEKFLKEEIRKAKELQEEDDIVKSREQELMKLVIEKFNEIIIAPDFETEMKFNDKLCKYTEALGVKMNLEYCAIGMCDGTFLYDIKPWLAFDLTAEQAATLEEVKKTRMTSSFIGELLNKGEDKFAWDYERDGDLVEFGNQKKITINISTATKYRDSLLRGELKHLLTIGLYSADEHRKPIGYLQLINRLNEDKSVSKNGFTENEIFYVEMFARKVEFALSNHSKYQLQLMNSKDSEFISKLMHKSAVDEILREMLVYLSREFGARVASYWIPTTDGFNEANKKIILRSVYVSSSGKPNEEDRALEAKLLNFKTAFSFKDCYIGESVEKGFGTFVDGKWIPQVICKPIFNHITNEAWSKFKAEIDSNYFVAIPLVKTRITDNPTENILGIICLRLKEGKEEFIKPRLIELSSHLSNLLENAIYHQRYKAIEQLKTHLHNIKFSDYDKFYDDVVRIVQDLLHAEACSLFILSDNKKSLTLKASTASAFIDNRDKLKPQKSSPKQLLNKDLYLVARDSSGNLVEKSITSEVFIRESSVIVYDVDSNPSTNWKHMEETESKKHKSLIAAPIIHYNGETIGVIRCINKKIYPESMIHAFFQGDKDFIDLIAVIISRFISNVEFNIAKKIFITQFGHESKHPLQGILNLVFDTRRFLELGDKTRVSKNLGLITSHALLIDYLLKDLELLDSTNSISKLVVPRQRDASKIVSEVVLTLKEQARFDRQIDIKTYTAKMPELLIDRDRFRQVLFNLMKNAIRYSNSAGEQSYGVGDIEISYNRVTKTYPDTENRAWDVLEVKNWGIGVLEEDRDRIFELYERGGNASKTHTSGTGIGLYVSRQIISGHKGFLELTKLKGPTTFTITIPAINN